MKSIILKNSKKVLDLKGLPHFVCGSYFQIFKVNNMNYLFYSGHDYLNLSISKNLDFEKGKKILNTDGNIFALYYDNTKFYIITGYHQKPKNGEDSMLIPDLVWPNEKTYRIKDVDNFNDKRKNGSYLLSSDNGFDWDYVKKKPIFHSFLYSDSCPLGSVCFDTQPRILFFNNEYIYYSRLNTGLDERLIWSSKSKDLMNWEEVKRVNIINETKYKQNYYLICPFIVKNKLFAFTQYFEACGTEKRNSFNGKTLLLRSNDAINWEIIGNCLNHTGRYKDRICDVRVYDSLIKIFVRENVKSYNQKIVSYDILYESFI